MKVKLHAFTLLEAILAMMICTFCVILLGILIAMMVSIRWQPYLVSKESSIHQIRMLYALSKDQHLEGDMLAFHYLQRDFVFCFDEDKLILNDGYQVFFSSLQDVFFTSADACHYIHYRFQGEEYEKRIIGCQK